MVSADALDATDHSVHSLKDVLEFARKAKYEYEVIVDPAQDDKSTEIILTKFGRPHMRAFHAAWFAFFMAFVSWFSIAPILPTIKVRVYNKSTHLISTNQTTIAIEYIF